ncbi:GFA family protein [Chitinilyticum litopenaei]|uniref:GFA family protein n=1 Tax=Chitinilyticum litopenaei TaxID=1121276 RepID=UPI0003FA8A91|nr:GFA family protein [Chitinilyticum litopenaei]
MKAHCLCNAVRIETGEYREAGACHCGMCRRWGGGPLLAVHCGSAVTITGEEHLRAYRSSDWAERAFCSQCGSHLYYRFLPTGEYIIPAGLFEAGTALDFRSEIFIDHKPAYYDFANNTEKLTEAEVLAQYAPQ